MKLQNRSPIKRPHPKTI